MLIIETGLNYVKGIDFGALYEKSSGNVKVPSGKNRLFTGIFQLTFGTSLVILSRQFL